MRAAAIATLATMSLASDIDTVYAKYVAQYKKNYLTSEEYEARLALFAKTHFMIEEHNMGNTYTLAHNMFSDWTADERANLTGYIPEDIEEEVQQVEETEYTGPVDYDWRVYLKSMKVSKNQGGCGSCWAFSTIGSIEARSELAGYGFISLSEQQLVDCVEHSNGCRGGNVAGAVEYVVGAGNTGEGDYPYKHQDGWCEDKKHPVRNHVTTGISRPTPKSPIALKKEILRGPVSVAIEADQPSFQHYHSGILPVNQCGKKLDHAVVAIGFGSENGQNYFIIRNSWGPNWGNNGTIKLQYTNTECACGCDIRPVAVEVKPKK
jgi:C1A family cysteine protease